MIRRTDRRAPQPVQLSLPSAVRLAVTLVATLLLLLVLVRSRLVIHWLITAGVAALVLDGPVRGLAERRVPRGLAVVLVTMGTLVGAVMLTYGAVDAVVEQFDNLGETAPDAVRDLVQRGGLADLERRFGLVARTSDLVATTPERLFGSPASAARTAAERLGEVVLVLTLTVFMLVAYERFEQRLLKMNAAGSPWRWVGVDLGLSIGASRARHVILRVLTLGAVTALVAAVAGLPGPVVLGLWAAWWRLLPGLGLVIGYAPLLVLLVTDHPQWVTGLALLVLVGVEAVARAADLHWAIRATPRVPMGLLSAVAFTGGFELGGVIGAVVSVVLGHLLVGVLQEAARAEEPVLQEGVS